MPNLFTAETPELKLTFDGSPKVLHLKLRPIASATDRAELVVVQENGNEVQGIQVRTSNNGKVGVQVKNVSGASDDMVVDANGNWSF